MKTFISEAFNFLGLLALLAMLLYGSPLVKEMLHGHHF